MKHHAVALAAGAAVGLAIPGTAQVMVQDDCAVLWSRVTGLWIDAAVTASPGTVEGGWCKVADIRVLPPGEYRPHLFADAVTFRDTGVEGLFDLSVAPEMPEVRVDGARLVPQIGFPQTDYAYRVLSLDEKVDGALTVSWDRATRAVNLSQFVLDFQGDNQIEVTGKLVNAELSSPGAAQSSLTGLALTEADVVATTQGLFETLVLMPLAPIVLPDTEDVEGAVVALKQQVAGAIAQLPPASFSDATKDALSRLVGDLPRPRGTFRLSLRSEVGLGPARLVRYAISGAPTTIADLAPVFEDVSINAVWDGSAAPE